MKLKTYIDQFPRAERRALRERIGRELDVEEITVRSWANGNRSVPAPMAVPLMRATDGHVKPWEVRPDVFTKEMFESAA